jgi:recombination protein RecA
MHSANAIRLQIEAALAQKVPSALSPAPRVIRPVAGVGIAAIDELLEGGLPLGAITEIVGEESSGRTSFALSFVSRMTRAGRVCAWVDVSNALHPESAAAMGVDLARLLWVRCGASDEVKQAAQKSFSVPEKYYAPRPAVKGLHGGGCGGHPRNEIRGLSDAVGRFLQPAALAPRCAEPQRRVRPERERFEPTQTERQVTHQRPAAGRPWPRMDQALRVTDLLLQAGGMSAIVLDMGSIAPEYVSRVPLATWFRYRAAAEKSQASILLVTQHASAKSSAGLVLRMQQGNALDDRTVFTGLKYSVEVVRERFKPGATNIVPMRKPPQRETAANWDCRSTWAGPR